MDILIGLTMMIFLPLAVVAVMHRWIGSYPEPYPESNDKRRELVEVIVLWLLAGAASTFYIFRLSAADLESPTAAVQLGHVAYAIVPFLILPLAYVVLMKKWTLRDLGFVLPRSRTMVIFALLFFGLPDVLAAFGEPRDPLPWSFIAIALYQPGFIEEFFFRVILQGKLERALGQNKAWFYSGILFGLMHVPVDFFGPQFYAHGSDYVQSFVLLLSQIIWGWIFGIIYSKTRSILPGMVVHFIGDHRLTSILLHLMP